MTTREASYPIYFVGQRVNFRSQWEPHFNNHILSEHLDEPAVVIALQLDGGGGLFNYELNVADGCKFWAAPWEVRFED